MLFLRFSENKTIQEVFFGVLLFMKSRATGVYYHTTARKTRAVFRFICTKRARYFVLYMPNSRQGDSRSASFSGGCARLSKINRSQAHGTFIDCAFAVRISNAKNGLRVSQMRGGGGGGSYNEVMAGCGVRAVAAMADLAIFNCAAAPVEVLEKRMCIKCR